MASSNRTGWNRLLNMPVNALMGAERARLSPVNLPISPRSILFVELTRLGDVVSMLPLVRSARILWPQARITVATQAGYAGLLKYLPFIDSELPLDLTRSPAGFLRARALIRHHRFDLAVSVSPALRNALLTLAARSHLKAGYFSKPEGTATFLDSSRVSGLGVRIKSVPPYQREHLGIRARRIADALAIPWTESVEWKVPAPVRDAVRTQLLSSPEEEQGQYRNEIVLHPFAGWRYREWDLRNFLTVAAGLAVSHTVVIAGTGMELAGLPAASSLPRGVTVFQVNALEDYAALIADARLFIGGDSGPLHLAASIGIPSIGLFGPAPPELTAPAAANVRTLYHRLDCSPCDQRTCVNPDRPCMSYLSTEAVLAEARRMLQRETVLE